MMMKLHLAAMACMVLLAGSVATATPANAGLPGTSTTECVPFKVARHTIHQRCTVTHTAADGSVWVSVYYIDQNGVWYLPAD